MSYALWKWTDFIQAKTWRLRPEAQLLLLSVCGALVPGGPELRAAGGRRQELQPVSRELQLRAGDGAPTVLRRQLHQHRPGEGPGSRRHPAGYLCAVRQACTRFRKILLIDLDAGNRNFPQMLGHNIAVW